MTLALNRHTFENVTRIEDQSRETDVSISSTIAQSSALAEGFYDVNSTIDCYISVRVDNSAVTTTTGYKLLANNVIRVYVPNNYKIGVISSSATGTLEIHRSGL